MMNIVQTDEFAKWFKRLRYVAVSARILVRV